MAPAAADKMKDRIDMIADISKTGKLMDMGCDPFTKAPENKAVATQTEGGSTKMSAIPDGGQAVQVHKAFEMMLANKEVVKSTDSPASQVLRLVVGMLGMEVHEQPSCWAEAWLTFEDQTFASLGLGTKKTARKDSDLNQESPLDWQMSVLERLREHVESRLNIGEQAHYLEGGHDWGPDFPEHLDLAEFALRRITHAVGVLEDPEKHDRPILLREYTEEMVLKVAKDLRQWLHQLGSLLSLYHVHLLDLEADRRRLAKLLEDSQQKFIDGGKEQEASIRKERVLTANWEEEKMRRDAERILGIKLAGDDAKIYSQADVDEMYRQWEKENLDPLLAELQELRLAREGLQDKLRDKGSTRRDHGGGGQPKTEIQVEASMGKASVALLVGVVDGINERVFDDPLNRLISRLASDIAKGGNGLAEILAEVNSMPIIDKSAMGQRDPLGGVDVGVGEAEHPALTCLDAMADEFNKLEAAARSCPSQNGAEKISFLAAWARDSANIVKGSIADGGKGGLRWLPPPKWDLGSLSRAQGDFRPTQTSGAKTSVVGSTGGGDEEAVRQQIEGEFETKMNRLRREMEAKLKEAWETAERERLNAQEALERLAEETAKADATLAELRKKIQMLEALLKEKGLGKQAADAIWGAGLSEFLQGKDVFERLYRDALDRMRRLAETQARFFEETSQDFLRTIGALIPGAKLPGFDEGSLSPSSVRASRPDTCLSTPPVPQRPLPQRPTDAFSMPRSAGGVLPTGTPSRSRSPPSSPAHATASRTSPRPVQSAPGRTSDPLSVARLLTPADIAATPHMKSQLQQQQRSEAKLQSAAFSQGPLARLQAQRGRDSSETGLAISSASKPPSANDGGMRRPATQQHVSSLAAKSRPFPPPASRGGRLSTDGNALPPLECRGQGRGESRSPSRDDMEARIRKFHGMRVGSPPREAQRTDHLDRLMSNNNQLLTIGTLRPSGAPAPPSGLLPPDMHHKVPSRPTTHGGRPGTHGAGRLARQGGALSMPNLGPPRLLVQSVGAAY